MNGFPDFFVVGTVKAGTTSLYNYLKQHPDVFVPAVKEIHFFAREIDPKHFIAGYGLNDNAHIRFATSAEDYLYHYRGANGKLKVDFAPSNLWSQHAAHEIYRVNPAAKIIALVRQPVERAFSHWLMDVKNGWADGSFVDSFERYAASKEKHWGNNRLYKELGLYTKPLQRYFDLFPREQVLVIDYDELRQNGEGIYGRMLQFLNLPPQESVELEAHNQSRMPRNAAFDAVYRNRSLRKRLKTILPNSVVGWMKQNLLSTERLPKLTPHDRQRLLPHFENDIEHLGVLLQRDFKHWLR